MNELCLKHDSMEEHVNGLMPCINRVLLLLLLLEASPEFIGSVRKTVSLWFPLLSCRLPGLRGGSAATGGDAAGLTEPGSVGRVLGFPEGRAQPDGGHPGQPRELAVVPAEVHPSPARAGLRRRCHHRPAQTTRLPAATRGGRGPTQDRGGTQSRPSLAELVSLQFCVFLF